MTATITRYAQYHSWNCSYFLKTTDGKNVTLKIFERGQEKPFMNQQNIQLDKIETIFAGHQIRDFLISAGFIPKVPSVAQYGGELPKPSLDLIETLCTPEKPLPEEDWKSLVVESAKIHREAALALCDAFVERFPREWDICALVAALALCDAFVERFPCERDVCALVAATMSKRSMRLHLLLKVFCHALQNNAPNISAYLVEAARECRVIADYKHVIRSHKYLMAHRDVSGAPISLAYLKVASLIPEDPPEALEKALRKISFYNPNLADFSTLDKEQLKQLQKRCRLLINEKKTSALSSQVTSLETMITEQRALIESLSSAVYHLQGQVQKLQEMPARPQRISPRTDSSSPTQHRNTMFLSHTTTTTTTPPPPTGH